MQNSAIAWTHHTINFWIGCNKVSAECEGCYAEAMDTKYGNDFGSLRQTDFKTVALAAKYDATAKAQDKTSLIFTCSMSDFFHQQADPWRTRAWEEIKRRKNLSWQILTKRPQRIKDHLPADWGENGYSNVMLGTTVGCKASYARVDELRQIPCALRFLSVEPLIEDISDLDLTGIGWVLVGGMSGPLHDKKPMRLEWAAKLHDKCKALGIPYFFKQVSAYRNEQGGNALGLYLAERDGKAADPAAVDWCREFPALPMQIMHPAGDTKGHGGFTMKQWEAYKKGQLLDQAELVTLG